MEVVIGGWHELLPLGHAVRWWLQLPRPDGGLVIGSADLRRAVGCARQRLPSSRAAVAHAPLDAQDLLGLVVGLGLGLTTVTPAVGTMDVATVQAGPHGVAIALRAEHWALATVDCY